MPKHLSEETNCRCNKCNSEIMKAPELGVGVITALAALTRRWRFVRYGRDSNANVCAKPNELAACARVTLQ